MSFPNPCVKPGAAARTECEHKAGAVRNRNHEDQPHAWMLRRRALDQFVSDQME